MARVALFLIDGFEETEALTTVDILRRGDVQVALVSLNGKAMVKSKHGVEIKTDSLFDPEACASFDMLVIPGGTTAYLDHAEFMRAVQAAAAARQKLAAICAAPAVFGQLGLLAGKRAVCYPGMETYLKGATIGDENVVTDGLITTSRGPGTAVPFALQLLKILQGETVARSVAEDFLVA